MVESLDNIVVVVYYVRCCPISECILKRSCYEYRSTDPGPTLRRDNCDLFFQPIHIETYWICIFFFFCCFSYLDKKSKYAMWYKLMYAGFWRITSLGY